MTDKKILSKGISYLGWAVPLLFTGPIIINSSFKNPNHPYYPYVLGFGILLCLGAMFLAFWGIKTIMKSLFGN